MYSFFEIQETFEVQKCQRKGCDNNVFQSYHGFDICNECLKELTKLRATKKEIKDFLNTKNTKNEKD